MELSEDMIASLLQETDSPLTPALTATTHLLKTRRNWYVLRICPSYLIDDTQAARRALRLERRQLREYMRQIKRKLLAVAAKKRLRVPSTVLAGLTGTAAAQTVATARPLLSVDALATPAPSALSDKTHAAGAVAGKLSVADISPDRIADLLRAETAAAAAAAPTDRDGEAEVTVASQELIRHIAKQKSGGAVVPGAAVTASVRTSSHCRCDCDITVRDIVRG